MSDPFDEHLRTRLVQSASNDPAAHAALTELGPSLRRAHRVHQVKTGVVALVAVMATVGLGAGLINNNLDGEGTTVIAAVPDDDSITTTSGPTTTSAPTPPTTAIPEPVTPTTSAPGADPATTNQTTPQTTTETPEPAATDTTPPSSAPPTTAPETTTPAPEQTTIDSECGSIIVSVNGDDIELVQSNADQGFAVDEKNEGPESVEVSFEGAARHCEIEAEVRDGALSSEVSNE